MVKFIAAVLGLFLVAGPATAEPFEEGEHYQRIESPTSTPEDRVEVIEAFAYPCPACRRFLPHITTWESDMPDYVSFSRLPVGLQPGWDQFAKAYYTAEVMGIVSENHEAMFHALHDEQRQFGSFEDIAEVYAEQGVSKESFLNTAESFAVDSRMRQNQNDVRRFGVRSTPTVIVQGKWRLTPKGFDSYQQVIEAVDYLVEREAKALGLTQETAEAPEEEPAAESR